MSWVTLFPLCFPSHHLMFNDKWCCWINTAQTYCYWFVPLVQNFPQFSTNFIFMFMLHDKNEMFEVKSIHLNKMSFFTCELTQTTMTMTIMMLMMSMLEIGWNLFFLNWLNFRFFLLLFIQRQKSTRKYKKSICHFGCDYLSK